MTGTPADPRIAQVITVYVDPSCPWTWNTSRWLHEVAPQRGLKLRWRSLSLMFRDGDRAAQGAPPEIRQLAVASNVQSHRLLRVFEALRAQGREDEIAVLYTLWGQRVFIPARPPVAQPAR
jgi:predicted DsbA family dithiol-disulfide isomerase